MSWPLVATIDTQYLDAASDSPALARGSLYNAFISMQDIINARGAADGIASLDSSSRVPVAQLPYSPFNGVYKDTAIGAGSWLVPAGVFRVFVMIAGGSGGGANKTGANFGAGGGAAPIGGKLWNVVPGDTINWNIGAGGAGGAAGGDNAGAAGTGTTAAHPTDGTEDISVGGGGGGGVVGSIYNPGSGGNGFSGNLVSTAGVAIRGPDGLPGAAYLYQPGRVANSGGFVGTRGGKGGSDGAAGGPFAALAGEGGGIAILW